MSWKPEREIEIVAGTPPGGGLDRSARALAKAIEANRLVDVPVKVVNVGGDGGRKAWAHMDGHAGDGHVIGISSPNMAADYLIGVTKSDPGPVLRRSRSSIPSTSPSSSAPIPPSVAAPICCNGFARDAAPSPSRSRPRSAIPTMSRSPTSSAMPAPTPGRRRSGCSIPRSMRSPTWSPATPMSAPSRPRARCPSSKPASLRTIGISSPARLPGPYAAAPTWTEQGVDCVVGSWRGASGPPGLDAAQIVVLAGRARGRHPDRRMESRSRPAFLDRDVSRRRSVARLSRPRAQRDAGVLGELGCCRLVSSRGAPELRMPTGP